jgi:hypothetical protein
LSSLLPVCFLLVFIWFVLCVKAWLSGWTNCLDAVELLSELQLH